MTTYQADARAATFNQYTVQATPIWHTATYTIDTDDIDTIGDDVELFTIPAGSVVIAGFLDREDCGGTVTCDVGTSSDDDAFFSAIPCGTAGCTLLEQTDARATAETTVVLTFDAVTTVTNGARITVGLLVLNLPNV